MTALLLWGIPPLLGAGVLAVCWPQRARSGAERLARACLAVGLGTAASSCSYFLTLVVLGPSRGALMAVEAALSLLALAAVIARARRSRREAAPSGRSPNEGVFQQPVRRWLAVAALLAALSAAASFAVLSAKSAHGRWDAWLIWNLRARFLFRGGEHWTDAFQLTPGILHPDYPLLIPASVARGWEYLGRETVAVPIAAAALFTAATIGLAVGAVARWRGWGQACLAALLLCGTPLLIELGVAQYADVPLGFFILATLVAGAWPAAAPGRRDGSPALAGLCAGCAVWTKNEGWLWLACYVAANALIRLPREGWTGLWRWLRAFGLGLGGMLAVVLVFKWRCASENDLLAQDFRTLPERLLSPDRLQLLLRALLKQTLTFGDWLVSAPLLLAAYAWMVGTEPPRGRWPERSIAGIALGLMACGYAVVYLTTPYDVEWHTRTSMYRLLMQLWPATVLVYLLTVKPPESLLPRAGPASPEA